MIEEGCKTRNVQTCHLSHIVIMDDLKYLQSIIRAMTVFRNLGSLILFTTTDMNDQAVVLVDLAFRSTMSSVPRVLVFTKPCGPEKLLYAIRLIEHGTEGAVVTGPRKRLTSELPPFPVLPENPRLFPKKLVAASWEIPMDLSRYITALVVNGKD